MVCYHGNQDLVSLSVSVIAEGLNWGFLYGCKIRREFRFGYKIRIASYEIIFVIIASSIMSQCNKILRV